MRQPRQSEGDLQKMRWLSDAVVQSMHGAGMRLDGQGWPMDFVEARRLFGLAAAQGQVTARKREDVRLAQCALGSMHLEGLGGPANLAEARRLTLTLTQTLTLTLSLSLSLSLSLTITLTFVSRKDWRLSRRHTILSRVTFEG